MRNRFPNPKLSTRATAACRLIARVTAIAAVILLATSSVNAYVQEETSALTGASGQSAAAALTHFETKIRPILVQHCYNCHSTTAGKSESGLRLDSRDALRAGGDRGPAIVPGKPEESLLITALSHADPGLQMPPKKDRLPESVILDFTEWIREGAVDPRDDSDTKSGRSHLDLETARQFWSWRTPVRPKTPELTDATWPTSDIDGFVFQKLLTEELTPSHDAEPSVLLRRLHFDLVGLPPTTAELEHFLQRIRTEGTEPALSAAVDRLLNSPQFGERWGRHWLDVARFAESSGKEANITFPYAWRYRDYVIDSVNEDLPFDQFLTEQLAGDLLPFDTSAERERLLIATGFLAVGPKNLDEADVRQFEADVVDEQIDAVGRAILANSIACARCHDHKFDPFTMEDYYGLAGIFRSTKSYFGTWVSPANRIGGDPLILPPVEGQKIFHDGITAEKVVELKTKLAALKKEQEDGMAAVYKAVLEGRDASEIFTLRDALRILWTSGGIEGSLEKVDESGKPLPLAMGVLDRELIADATLFESGDIHRAGESVPRGFPRILPLSDSAISDPANRSSALPANQSGRLQLAQWLTHADNPLTARVMANRVWHHLMGAGLVRTVDNFGMSGERPSHPELLDLLAVQFVDDGWSVKKLIRRIVLSRTYRQSSDYRESAFRKDPENRLLWRAAKRRLDAECIRDAMLAVSSELDPTRPDGSLVARVIGDKPVSLIGLDKRIPADLDHSLHRAVYLPVLRDRLPDVLDLFDFAEPSLVTGARESTNVPLQALYLMNSPFVTERAAAFAERLRRESADSDTQIRLACRSCFAREPDETELSDLRAFLQTAIPPVESAVESAVTSAPNEGSEAAQDSSDAPSPIDNLTALCQALLATAEFRILD